MKIEHDKTHRFKTVRHYVTRPDGSDFELTSDPATWPNKGVAVAVADGAFVGWKGTVVDVDGEWLTIECKAAP